MKHPIHIPEPCHEDWNKMTEVERGRHCEKCAKTVHDVTHLNNEQVYDAYEKNNQSLCIRIPAYRLSEMPQSPAKTGWKYLALASLMTFWLGVKKVFGATPHAPNSLSKVSENDTANQQDSVIHNMIVRGVIRDSLNNSTPMPFANIRVIKKDTVLEEGISDIDGLFNLQLTDSVSSSDTLKIEVEYVGFEKISQSFQPRDTMQLEIYLTELHICMGKEVVVERGRYFMGLPHIVTGIMISNSGHKSIKRPLLDDYDTKTYHHDELERYNLGR